MDYYKLKVLNNKRIIIIIIFILIICGGLVYYFCFYSDTKNEVIREEIIINDKPTIKEDNEVIYIDIKGFVAKPGVYSFNKSDNARIDDLIIKAGGLKKDADTSILNLSRKLEDEMTVIIYSKNEIENYTKNQNELKEKLEICELKVKNNACIEKESKEEMKLININNATLDELVTLKGIGESKAKDIIEYRKNSPFKSIDELKNISGISEAIFENIKNSITI